MNGILNVIINILHAIADVALPVAYVAYALMVIIELAVLVFLDFRKQEVSWWTLLYPVVVTAIVLIFNWEFSLLLEVYANPAHHGSVWVAFAILSLGTYGAYAYYPKARRMTMLGEWRVNRWSNPDNGPPIKRTR